MRMCSPLAKIQTMVADTKYNMVRMMGSDCGKAIVTNTHHKYCNEEAKDGKCPDGKGVKYGERGCRCENDGGGFQV